LAVSSWEALSTTCSCPFSTDFTSVSDGGWRADPLLLSPQSAAASQRAPHPGMFHREG
jgi:hypothetical protein